MAVTEEMSQHTQVLSAVPGLAGMELTFPPQLQLEDLIRKHSRTSEEALSNSVSIYSTNKSSFWLFNAVGTQQGAKSKHHS